jgi:hypothetical protein
MKKTLIALAALLGLAVNSQAQLDALNFSDTGADFSFTGTIYGTPVGNNDFIVTSGSATFSQSSDMFAGLTASIVPNPNAPQPTVNYGIAIQYDNLALDNQQPAVTDPGLLFSLVSGGQTYYVNPYDSAGSDRTVVTLNGSVVAPPAPEVVINDNGPVAQSHITITSGFVPAAPGAPAPPLTACLAFAGVLLLQSLRKRRAV